MTATQALSVPEKIRRRRGASTGTAGIGSRPGFLTYGLLAAFIIGSVYPLWWSVVVASGTNATRGETLPLFPGGNFFTNAAKVFDAIPFWLALGNSFLISGIITISVVTFSTLAGYAFAKLRFKGSKGLLIFVIATMAVPTQLGIVPLFIAMSQWFHLSGNLLAVILPALVNAFGVFWMTQYLTQSLPDELIEAARVDGASMIRTFWHVGLPAARPAAAMLDSTASDGHRRLPRGCGTTAPVVSFSRSIERSIRGRMSGAVIAGHRSNRCAR